MLSCDQHSQIFAIDLQKNCSLKWSKLFQINSTANYFRHYQNVLPICHCNWLDKHKVSALNILQLSSCLGKSISVVYRIILLDSGGILDKSVLDHQLV